MTQPLAFGRKEVLARYRAAHPERIRASENRWRASSPWMKAIRAVWKARHRALALGMDAGDLTRETMARLHLLPCHYCGVTPAMGADHVVPLSRGGPNTVANLVPSCLPCNHRKYAKVAIA